MYIYEAFFSLKLKENQPSSINFPNKFLENVISGNKKAMKGMFIGVAMNTISYFTAYYTLTSYATLIFDRTDSTLFSPYISTILMAVALTFGSLTSTYLADKLGRKCLCNLSLVGSAFGLLAMAIHYYLFLVGCDLSSFKWVPVLSLSFTIFIAAAGIIPLAAVCSVENLPTKVRHHFDCIHFRHGIYSSNKLILFADP